MAISRGTIKKGGSASATTSTTISAVDCNGYGYLEVGLIVSSDATDETNVVFNTSETMTLVEFAERTSTNLMRLAVYRLYNPSQVSADVVISHPSTICCAMAVPYSGLEASATPYDAVQKGGSNSSSNPTIGGLTATWGGGDDKLMFWMGQKNTSNTFTIDAGVTEIDRNESSSGASHVRIALIEDNQTETTKDLGEFSGTSGFAVIFYNMNAGAGSAIAVKSGLKQRGLN